MGAARLRGELAAAVLATVLASLPLAFRGVSVGDEGHLVAIADRLAGTDAVLYRDVATNIPPFSYELLALAFRLLGTSLEVERLLGVAVGGIAGAACFLLGWQRAGRQGAWCAVAALLGLRLLAFPHWHLFYYTEAATGLALLALAAVRDATPRSLLAAGALLGLASGFKQNVGAFAALGALLLVARTAAPARRVSSVALLLGPPVALGVALVARAAAQGALGPFLHWNVGYFLGTFAKDLHVPYPRMTPGAGLWPEMGTGVALFFYLPSVLVGAPAAFGAALAHPGAAAAVVRALYLVPAAAAAASLVVARRDPREPLGPFALLSLTSLFPLSDFSHYLDALLPAALLVAARGGRAGVALAGLLAGLGLAAGIATHGRLDTPVALGKAGSLRLDAEAARTMEALHGELARLVPAGAPILALPYCPLLYVTGGYENPTPLYLPFPSYLDGAGQERVIAAAGGVRAVVWDEAAWPHLPPFRVCAPRLAAFLDGSFVEAARVDGPGGRPAYRILLRAEARGGSAASGARPPPASR